MLKDRTSSAPGQNQSDPPHTAKPATAKRKGFPANCDIFFIRHIFKSIETDFTRILERKFRHLQSLDARLGSAKIFDLPDDEAGKIHRQREAHKYEMDVLFSMSDYLDSLTTFCVESWANLNDSWAARCQKLEEENAALRAAHRQALNTESTVWEMWINSLTNLSDRKK